MGWKQKVKDLQQLGNLRASVGWHSTAKYPDGTPVAGVAATQEYGNTKNGTPPRSHTRSTIGEQSAEWSRQAGLGFKAVAQGTRSPHQVVTEIGELAAADVRKKITQIETPPLAESTIRQRVRQGYKPDKPLVRSGLMLATCTSEVEEL